MASFAPEVYGFQLIAGWFKESLWPHVLFFFDEMLTGRVTNVIHSLCGPFGYTYMYFSGMYMYTSVDKVGLSISVSS